MTGKVMSMGLSEAPQSDRTIDADDPRLQVQTIAPHAGWNPEDFLREQIRGLVRQVFFSPVAPAVRQVLFSPVDAEIDVRRICRRVGEALALETSASIALAGDYPKLYEDPAGCADQDLSGAWRLHQVATRLRGQLWLVPLDRDGDDSFSTTSVHTHLCQLRREFEYSIVEGAPTGASNEATAMAQQADGVILILSAHRTRRATARNVKQHLEAARARILGTVLSDRVFPIPEAIYRRL